MTDFDTCSMSLAPVVQDPGRVPVLFRDAGEQAWRKFIEFFTARIRNRNTRDAYARVVRQFSEWCVARRLTLHQLNPFFVAAYIEDLGAAPSTS